jgi:transcriptional regulator with XRE-family HTH domain
MPRWKELPSSLDERVRKLVVQLRWLKDHSGLSLSSLQSKTGYSRSSWERYLNGRALPPRGALEKLAQVGGVDPTRLLALHEVAEVAWQQQAGAAQAGDSPQPRSSRRVVLIGVCTTVVLGALLVGLLVTAPWKDGGDGEKGTAGAQPSSASSSRPVFAYKPGKTYPCTVRRDNGRLYAGYSTTSTTVLSGPSWDVVEAQCLLRHLGFDPGGADGDYGPNTTQAVRRLQQKTGLPPDGIVGPHTWKVLRGG